MDAVRVLSPKIDMSSKEERALWRQRFFEAQAGMEKYLVEKYGQNEISRWLPVKAEILKDLDDVAAEKKDVAFWKDRFFRTQALLEKYVVGNHGIEDLVPWTDAIGQVFKFTEPNRGGGAGDFALRLAKQAHCYDSDYEIALARKDRARFILHHCAIWDYREQARQRGVTLTLSSPCLYCTKATVANAKAKGYAATFELQTRASDHGCTWEIENENSN
jgi:hypothetical protein